MIAEHNLICLNNEDSVEFTCYAGLHSKCIPTLALQEFCPLSIIWKSSYLQILNIGMAYIQVFPPGMITVFYNLSTWREETIWKT
jgi:hypothetical protein